MISSKGHWSDWVRRCEERGEPYVLITVLGPRGSTPRDAGTKMLVRVDGFDGTIGGGTLEHDALQRARSLLSGNAAGQWVENYPLGEKLGQCCGGSTSLLFESFVPQVHAVYLFGAGHVGRALASLLATLPLRVHWVDSRSEEYPAELPPGVRAVLSDEPVDCVRDAPADSYYIIMTHQHPLDFALMEAALKRGDARYIGVIGSASKARRFRQRLQHRGYPAAAIDGIRCPIGHADVPGKRPAEIAVSVAAQIINHYHASRDCGQTPGPRWKDLQHTLEAAHDASAVLNTDFKETS